MRPRGFPEIAHFRVVRLDVVQVDVEEWADIFDGGWPDAQLERELLQVRPSRRVRICAVQLSLLHFGVVAYQNI